MLNCEIPNRLSGCGRARGSDRDDPRVRADPPAASNRAPRRRSRPPPRRWQRRSSFREPSERLHRRHHRTIESIIHSRIGDGYGLASPDADGPPRHGDCAGDSLHHSGYDTGARARISCNVRAGVTGDVLCVSASVRLCMQLLFGVYNVVCQRALAGIPFLGFGLWVRAPTRLPLTLATLHRPRFAPRLISASACHPRSVGVYRCPSSGCDCAVFRTAMGSSTWTPGATPGCLWA